MFFKTILFIIINGPARSYKLVVAAVVVAAAVQIAIGVLYWKTIEINFNAWKKGAKGDWDFRISVKKSDGINI